MESTKPYVVYVNSTADTLAIDPSAQSDPFYRYKTRQLVVQTIGNGKMIRTALTNSDDVGRDLKVPPSYIPHYLAKTIGAQATYEPGKPAMQRATISGEHETKDLSNLLVRFIREFVLCSKCRLPELEYAPRKDDLVMRCHSCGWKGNLSTIPMNDKFKRYVYTHPPPRRTGASAGAASGAKSARGPKGKASGKASAKTTPKAAPKASSAKEKEKEKEVVWLSDLSDKAREERMETMVPERLKALVAGVAGEEEETPAEPSKTPLEILKEFIATKPGDDKIIAEVKRLRTEHSLDKKAAVILVCDVLIPDLATLLANLKTYTSLFAKFIGEEAFSQAVFLSVLEKRIGSEKGKAKNEFLAKKAMLMFKDLYENDILEEDTILQWYRPDEDDSSPQQDALRKAVSPFCKWLEEAESESDSEEEDDAPATSKVAATTTPSPPPKEEKDSDLDDEIDAL